MTPSFNSNFSETKNILQWSSEMFFKYLWNLSAALLADFCVNSYLVVRVVKKVQSSSFSHFIYASFILGIDLVFSSYIFPIIISQLGTVRPYKITGRTCRIIELVLSFLKHSLWMPKVVWHPLKVNLSVSLGHVQLGWSPPEPNQYFLS